MKVISTNIGARKKVMWNGEEIETGIYKYPVEEAIFLGKEDVQGDAVVDRRYHGGIDKACYCYSSNYYSFWKARYPHADWNWGMFGENLTIDGLDESNIQIGDVYQLGEAKVEVSQPRQPCFKLGIRFGTPKILKAFTNGNYPGVYLRVLEPGAVAKGDEMHLLEREENAATVLEIYELLFRKTADQAVVKRALATEKLSESHKDRIRQKWSK